MILTVLNEASSIERVLTSLRSQTVAPDEIVVADAGSNDGTIEAITAAAANDARIRLLSAVGSRSFGRNKAIEAAAGSIIACIDGSCVADPTWLENLLQPFESGATWVAGFYKVEADSIVDRCIGLTMVPVIEEIDPGEFLPSARSMAFTRELWSAVGGFPEEVEFAEDTLFDERLMGMGFLPVFADAVVRWRPPRGFAGLVRASFRWGRGDGLTRSRGWYYPKALRLLLVCIAAGVVLLVLYPRAFPLFVVLALAPHVWKTTRYKYRHVTGRAKWVLIPTARVSATAATLTGYLVGRLIDRPR